MDNGSQIFSDTDNFKSASNENYKFPIKSNIRSTSTPSFQTGFGPLTDNLINKIFNNIDNENLRNKLIDKIIDPLTDILNKRMRPYLYTVIILYCVIVVLLLIIIYLIIANRKK